MTNVKVTSAWRHKPLRQVAEVVKGKKPQVFASEYSKGVLPYLEAAVLRYQSTPQWIALKYADGLVVADETDTLVLWDGANAGDVFPGQVGVLASTMARVRIATNQLLPEFLFYCLLAKAPLLRETAAGSTVPHVRSKVLADLPVPLPPLPVQERIVAILQKADEIRRKRKEALELARTLVPAMFKTMFDMSAGYPVETLGSICEIKGGKRLPKGASYSHAPTRYRYLRATDVRDGKINSESLMYLDEDTQRKIARYTTSAGDVVISIAGEAGITAIVPEHADEVWNLTENMALLRCRLASQRHVVPSYLLWFLRSERGQAQIKQLVASSTIQKLALFRLASIQIPVPPLHLQGAFDNLQKIAEGLIDIHNARNSDANLTFYSLLSRAFTEELTAEWEAANAEWIAEQQALYERLPRLLVLALLVEKAKRARRAAAEALVTALMKYAFLLQMEGSGAHRRFYHFVPYHYGPFAKELYSDLQALQDEGLVHVASVPEEEKTKITVTDLAKAEEALADLPADLKKDAATIIETYGDLDHNALLKTVYEKYPSYARKSRLRQRSRRR